MDLDTRQYVRESGPARGVVARGVGHNQALEAPGRFARLVRAWLGDLALPAGLEPLH